MKKTLFLIIAAGFLAASCGNSKPSQSTEADNQVAVAPSIEQTYGEWKITRIGELAVDFEATLSLNESRFSARVCNLLNGDVVCKERRADAIRLNLTMQTLMACPEPEDGAERALKEALAKVRTFEVGSNRLVLLDEEGSALVVAER